MTLTLKVDANAAYNAVLQQKQVPYAMNLAMNSWMFSTNKFLKNKIDNYLEGGAEQYTKNGFRVDRVKNKRDLNGSLYISLKHNKPYLDRYYLKNIIEGGNILPPTPTRRKLMQPIEGRVKLNAKGNLTKNKFSSLRAQEKKYFYGIPKGREGENYRGLWQRMGVSAKNPGGKKIKMIIALGKESRRIRRLFPAAQLSKAEFNRNFWRHFAIQYRKAIRSAKKVSLSKL